MTTLCSWHQRPVYMPDTDGGALTPEDRERCRSNWQRRVARLAQLDAETRRLDAERRELEALLALPTTGRRPFVYRAALLDAAERLGEFSCYELADELGGANAASLRVRLHELAAEGVVRDLGRRLRPNGGVALMFAWVGDR